MPTEELTRRRATLTAAGALLMLGGGIAVAAEVPAFRPPQQRYRDLWADAARRNPIDPSFSADGYGPLAAAAIKAIGPDPGSGFTLYRAADHPGLFTLYGGSKHLRYDDWQALSVTYPDGHPGPNTGRVAFMTNGLELDLQVAVSQTASYRVLVDGLYVSRDSVLTRSKQGARDFLRVTLAARAQPGPMRRIDIEVFSPEGAFGGVAIAPHTVIRAVNTGERYRIACFGDSISAGTGCVNQNDSWNVVAGYLLGGVALDMVQMSQGGTGFLRDGPTWRASKHISDLTAQPIDELWIAMGINDAGYSPDEISAAAFAFFVDARRLLPEAPVVVLGIARDDSDRAVAAEAALEKAFVAWSDPLSTWIPFQTPGAKLFTGSVDQSGNFSSNKYGGGQDGKDNTHPNRLGHRYMGGVVARAIRAAQIS